MSMPTTYSVKSTGRIIYLFWGVLAVVCGGLILSALIFTTRPDHTWLEYVFVGLILLLIFISSIASLLKAFQANPRLEVSEKGFIYHGLFKARMVLWAEVVSIKYIHERGGFHWLKFRVNTGSEKKSFKLDFTELTPDYLAFIRQARTFAPSADFGVFGLYPRKPYSLAEAAQHNPNPVFEKLRQDTQQLSAAEGRDGLLAELGRLEESERVIRHDRAGEAAYQAYKHKTYSLSVLLVLAVAIGLGVYLYQIISSGQSENHNHQMVYLGSDPVVFWLNLFFPIFIFIVSVVGLVTMVFPGRTSGKRADAERNIRGNGVGRKQANPKEPVRGNARQ